jgi:hypothetical protein
MRGAHVRSSAPQRFKRGEMLGTLRTHAHKRPPLPHVKGDPHLHAVHPAAPPPAPPPTPYWEDKGRSSITSSSALCLRALSR